MGRGKSLEWSEVHLSGVGVDDVGRALAGEDYALVVDPALFKPVVNGVPHPEQHPVAGAVHVAHPQLGGIHGMPLVAVEVDRLGIERIA